jgi:hypothetical protein
MVKPPARALRLLANLWLPAAILFGLVTIGLVSTTIQSFVALVTQASDPDSHVAGYFLGVLVGGFAAVVLGRITWRLAVEVPRTVRSWEEALVERRTAGVN